MISVQNVSKLYRIYEQPSGRLKEILLRGRQKHHRDFWALEDVSLEVARGEAVGIIGRNGAGKTTVLQIIAGVLQPTHGRVSVDGRVTALLELGSGFNPEFTGRENILLSGQILGFSEAQMKQRLKGITEFAELEAFVDQPVKTYSTGMIMRLAFASAIHVDPDVLIVDEALSVGDVYFQRKSLDRMEYFRKAGKTVLFVSHDPQLIQRFCKRVVWLESGRVRMTGDSREVITAYQAFCAKLEDERLQNAARSGGIGQREHEEILRKLQLTGSRWGNGKIRFTNIEMINTRGEATWVFNSGEPVTIRLQYEAEADFPTPTFAVDVHRFDGIFVASINSFDAQATPLPVRKGSGTIDLKIARLDLTFSSYYLSLKATVGRTENCEPDWADPADVHNQMYQFDMLTEHVIHGLMKFNAQWRRGEKDGAAIG